MQDELEALADTLDEITKFEAGHFSIELRLQPMLAKLLYRNFWTRYRNLRYP